MGVAHNRGGRSQHTYEDITLLIETYTLKQMDFNDPQGSQIDLRDIIQSLSNIARFTGHVEIFDRKNIQQIWSVAKHSMYVSLLAPSFLRREALCHDFVEAYIGDIARPLKDYLGAQIKNLEAKIMGLLIEKFDLNPKHLQLIKEYDHAALRYEVKYLFHGTLSLYPELPTLPDPKVSELKQLAHLPIRDTRNKFMKQLNSVGIAI